MTRSFNVLHPSFQRPVKAPIYHECKTEKHNIKGKNLVRNKDLTVSIYVG